MLTPDYLAKVADGSEQIASDLHEYMIKKIVDRMMARLGRGEDCIFSASDKWQINILQDAGYLLEDITAELAKYTKRQQKEVKAAMEEAGVKALQADAAIYEAAGLSPLPLWESPQLVRLMERNYEKTFGEWQNYTGTTAKAAQQLFINECDKAYNRVVSGATTYNVAVKEALQEIVHDGVYVKYPSGHRDTIETATARAVRTGIAQTTGDICMKRMEEMDWEIILVSAHVGARRGDGGENPGNHSWWQGKFYSRTGKDNRFPPFSVTGWGSGEGLSGYNCRHSFGSSDGVNNPFAELRDADQKDAGKTEKLEKKQRALERGIRHTKREVMGMQEAVEKCTDEKLKFELQQELDKESFLLKKKNLAYSEYCKTNNLRSQSERTAIAGWEREQSKKSIAAAKRYEAAKGAKK